jgi:hypothetical protein
MEQFFTPADVFKMDGNQVPGLTILSITLVALKCRPVEEFLNYDWDWDWDWEALLLSRGCAEQNCMDHRRHASYDRRCSPIFSLTTTLSYDCLLMADFSMTISGQVQILQCLQFLEVDVSTAAI